MNEKWGQNRDFHLKALSASRRNCFSTREKNYEGAASDITMPTTI